MGPNWTRWVSSPSHCQPTCRVHYPWVGVMKWNPLTNFHEGGLPKVNAHSRIYSPCLSIVRTRNGTFVSHLTRKRKRRIQLWVSVHGKHFAQYQRATLNMIFSVTYYLNLHGAISFYYRNIFLPSKVVNAL